MATCQHLTHVWANGQWRCMVCNAIIDAPPPKPPSPEQLEQQRQYRQEEEELKAATDALFSHERAAYEFLNALVDKLYAAGVDVSYFPHRASLVLVNAAKQLAAKGFKD
jgi:uncharacterized protein YPO0396